MLFRSWQYPAAGAAILAGVFIWLAPPPLAVAANAPTLAQVEPIITARCAGCHAEHPTLMPAAPAGVLLDTPEHIRTQAPRVIVQAVKLKAMPLGNVTAMTPAERDTLAAWAAGGLK